MRPYYEQDGVTIYHADCRDVLPSLSGIAVTVTSPPYNTLGTRLPKIGTGVKGRIQCRRLLTLHCDYAHFPPS